MAHWVTVVAVLGVVSLCLELFPEVLAASNKTKTGKKRRQPRWLRKNTRTQEFQNLADATEKMWTALTNETSIGESMEKQDLVVNCGLVFKEVRIKRCRKSNPILLQRMEDFRELLKEATEHCNITSKVMLQALARYNSELKNSCGGKPKIRQRPANCSMKTVCAHGNTDTQKQQLLILTTQIWCTLKQMTDYPSRFTCTDRGPVKNKAGKRRGRNNRKKTNKDKKRRNKKGGKRGNKKGGKRGNKKGGKRGNKKGGKRGNKKGGKRGNKKGKKGSQKNGGEKPRRKD